jgi:lipoprotein-anchoring transpeptidase ErfK/SrfK
MKRITGTMSRLAAAMAVTIALQERATAQAAAVQVIRRIVINVPAMTLDLYENGEKVKSYRTAVGRPKTPSPVGNFRIGTKVVDPTWYGPDQVVEPGPQNPVGTRWIGLSKRGYGIHGTNAPKSIGRAASHGCIRMRNADVEDLFRRVAIGDEVEIIYEVRTADGKLLPDIYGLAVAEAVTTATAASAGGR